MSPAFLRPFILDPPPAGWERHGQIDISLPTEAGGLRPAIVFVHGGPVPEAQRPTPRDWPVFAGYRSLAVAFGLAGAVVDHRLHAPADYALAAADVEAAVAEVRAFRGVDPDRVALWFFSGGGLLAADWLRGTPSWIRCLAFSYPALAPLPGWDVEARFHPVQALADVGGLPLLLTRVSGERPEIATTQEEFLDGSREHGVEVEVIAVPEALHGFDVLEPTLAARGAVRQAMCWVATRLRR